MQVDDKDAEPQNQQYRHAAAHRGLRALRTDGKNDDDSPISRKVGAGGKGGAQVPPLPSSRPTGMLAKKGTAGGDSDDGDWLECW
jgi:hypothetical protein